MFLGTPGPKNPAAWVQRHPNATVFLDRPAFGELDEALLEDGDWSVTFHDAVPSLLGQSV
jgi:hypothetical protein